MHIAVSRSDILWDQVVDLPGTADQISYHTLAIRVLNGYGIQLSKEWWPVTAAGAPTAHGASSTLSTLPVYMPFWLPSIGRTLDPGSDRRIVASLVGIPDRTTYFWEAAAWLRLDNSCLRVFCLLCWRFDDRAVLHNCNPLGLYLQFH